MKCLILAGGRGERFWPLSRNGFPKQFIKVQKDHSLFQETVARNIAFCDEFIIVTNYAYRFVIANQMEAFQGVPYRCVFEEEPRKTLAAIALGCLGLQPSEYVFAVSSNHLIDTGDCTGLSYKDAILTAKEYAKTGNIVVFGIRTDDISSKFGYFTGDGRSFIEKPDSGQIEELQDHAPVYQNIGMVLFQCGTFINELKKHQPDIYERCRSASGEAFKDGILFSSEELSNIEALSVERGVIERTDKLKGISVGFKWSNVGSLEDISKTGLSNDGIGIVNDCDNTTVINRSCQQAVVVNCIDDALVVNTADAVYIGRKGNSDLLKGILHNNSSLAPYAEQSTVFYRPWGYYERLAEGSGYWVRKVTLLPGRTIYDHTHDLRTENWTFIAGYAKVTLNGSSKEYGPDEHIIILPGTSHQVSNIGDVPAVFIETSTGDILNTGDTLSNAVSDLTDADLGLRPDPLIRLKPAFKDYLWGGTKLRDVYGKCCDFDTIAESWELSAHPAGNSIVASGRHLGSSFSRYLEIVGKGVLGWKCAPMQAFPLLIKFIDAKQDLSVQVHPDDDYALEKENEYGKNEMWYVVDSEPGAGLYIGFDHDVSRSEVESRIAEDSILDIMNFYPVKAGDVFFIPAGTVHAIGAGNLICEIQQSSNTTYRLFDYRRRDKFGNTRELHLQKALDVLDYKKYEPVKLWRKDGTIRCKYFEVEIINVDGDLKTTITDDSFRSVVCIAGKGELNLENCELEIKAGDSAFIPAGNGHLHINGRMTILLTKV